MEIRMNNENIVRLMNEYIKDDDVRDTAQYIIFRNNLVQMATGSLEMSVTQVPDVAPEQVLLVMDSDNNFLHNVFYQKNFAVIKVLIAQEDILLASRSMHFAHSKQDMFSGQVVRELLVNRFGALTMIVFLAYGVKVAKEFDFKLRAIVSMTDEERDFFKSYGVL